eukprot:4315195-Alexandrium_andersonii.AAC.1
MGRAALAPEQLQRTTVERARAFLAAVAPANGVGLPGIREAFAGAAPEDGAEERCKVYAAFRGWDGL